MTDSFIPLSRALLEWDWHNEPKTGWLYVVMLMMANHEETRWRGETLRRGQLLTGRKQLSIASGLTEDEVRTALAHLKKTEDISVTAKAKYSIVTMLRYEEHCPADPQQAAAQIPSNFPDESPAFSPAESPTDPQHIPSKAPADPHIQKLKNLKTQKKAADDAPAGEGHAGINTPDMAAIEDMWQRMGNRVTANDIFRFEQAIADGHSVGDILDAMKEADEHGARESRAYVKTVLENWRVNGRREKPPKKDEEEYDPYAGLPVFGSWDS